MLKLLTEIDFLQWMRGVFVQITSILKETIIALVIQINSEDLFNQSRYLIYIHLIYAVLSPYRTPGSELLRCLAVSLSVLDVVRDGGRRRIGGILHLETSGGIGFRPQHNRTVRRVVAREIETYMDPCHCHDTGNILWYIILLLFVSLLKR